MTHHHHFPERNFTLTGSDIVEGTRVYYGAQGEASSRDRFTAKVNIVEIQAPGKHVDRGHLPNVLSLHADPFLNLFTWGRDAMRVANNDLLFALFDDYARRAGHPRELWRGVAQADANLSARWVERFPGHFTITGEFLEALFNTLCERQLGGAA